MQQEHIYVFARRTRDRKVTVYRDKMSGVIFIDDFFVGENEYEKGVYRERFFSRVTGFEDVADNARRFESYKQFLCGRTVCDFGCGAGDFLKKASSVATEVVGVEIQKNFRENIRSLGFKCSETLKACGEDPFDVITLFHVLEHLPDQRGQLSDVYKSLAPNGRGVVIIEVPHAKDFLMEHLCVEEFIDFTLWSQHLVLHTRESLTRLLSDAGFKNIVVEGVQRYPLANHLHWLTAGKPGGHKVPISAFESGELRDAYARALARIDATDTIVAVAST